MSIRDWSSGVCSSDLVDGIVKSTAGEWPGPAVAALRYVFGAAALGVLLAIRHGRAGFVVPRMGIQFGRGASVAMATLCFYVGVQLMPLADVTAVQFVSPVFVALLSPLMQIGRASCGERVCQYV